MLDQLVESRNNSQQNRRSLTFFLVIGCIILTVFGSAWLRSLFAKELGIGGEDLELSSLVAPVPVPEAEPPKPEPIKQEEKQTTVKTNETVLKEAPVQDINTPPKETPKTQVTKSDAISINKITGPVRVDPNASSNQIASTTSGRSNGDPGGSGGSGIPPRVTQAPPKDDDDAPPPPKPTPTPPKPTPTPEKTPPPPPKIVSGGVVNGKAVSLVKPAYPPAAKAVGAKGSVSVSVVIDENGNVISASAAGGHPLLQPAAVAAARASKFSPTMLSGQKVKVSGVIVYNFQ